jgi:hypothetical protein
MTATALPDPAGLSNDQLVEIELDQHAHATSEPYRQWFAEAMAEYARRGLNERHPAA